MYLYRPMKVSKEYLTKDALRESLPCTLKYIVRCSIVKYRHKHCNQSNITDDEAMPTKYYLLIYLSQYEYIHIGYKR